MKLYHGTAERYLNAILEDGIMPRRMASIDGNWDQTLSRPDMVYLGEAYPIFYALHAADGDKAVVIEIELDEMDEAFLYPDEDFIWEALKQKVPHPEVIKTLLNYQHHWRDSLERLGNCCHRGVISPDSFTRYCIFDQRERPKLAMQIDPSICMANYFIMGQYYRDFVAYFFGDRELIPMQIDEPKYVEFWTKESANRTGIQVVEVQHETA